MQIFTRITTNRAQILHCKRELSIEACPNKDEGIGLLNLDTYSQSEIARRPILYRRGFANKTVKISKSQSLPTTASIVGIGLSMPIVLSANIARSQSKNTSEEDSLPSESTAVSANRQLQKALPSNIANPSHIKEPNRTANSTETPAPPDSTSIGTAKYTFVISTPALIGVGVVIGAIALFPVLSLLLSSTKVAELRKNNLFLKFTERFRKPQILESDKFLHNRTFDKLAQISNQAENINADKFGNTEFTTFFKIKSYISRSIDEYANLDEIIEMLRVAIDAQLSFAKIDSTESRHCSSGQQKLYKFVNELLTQELDSATFKEQVERKLEEVLPLLKTEEGKVPLHAYVKEVCKVAEHPFGLKLILLFKKHQLNDYSTLRSVSDTINLLDSEDLLNLDSLMLLVMAKYDVFERLGPIVGIEDKYNRPETYSKMLQYIGLKSRFDSSYQKFQEFLLLLKQWETHYKTILNVRNKYSDKEYRLPKEFSAEVPGLALYHKYKDSFHLITVTPPTVATATAPAAAEQPVVTAPVAPAAAEQPVVTAPVAPVATEQPVVTAPVAPAAAEQPVVTAPVETVEPELPVLIYSAETAEPEISVLTGAK